MKAYECSEYGHMWDLVIRDGEPVGVFCRDCDEKHDIELLATCSPTETSER